MNPLYLVLAGAAISLITSVVVTWLQGRYLRRGEDKNAMRDSIRQLTKLFIAERESRNSQSTASAERPGIGDSDRLAEAEMLCTTISDHRTRERTRAVIRLLRECGLAEMEELSGVKATRARQLLFDHALDVLGAHFRGERTPAMPDSIQAMLKVEDEALNIYSGITPKPVENPTENPTEKPAAKPAAKPEPKKPAEPVKPKGD